MHAHVVARRSCNQESNRAQLADTDCQHRFVRPQGARDLAMRGPVPSAYADPSSNLLDPLAQGVLRRHFGGKHICARVLEWRRRTTRCHEELSFEFEELSTHLVAAESTPVSGAQRFEAIEKFEGCGPVGQSGVA